jgi:hypothetical protein
VPSIEGKNIFVIQSDPNASDEAATSVYQQGGEKYEETFFQFPMDSKIHA